MTTCSVCSVCHSEDGLHYKNLQNGKGEMIGASCYDALVLSEIEKLKRMTPRDFVEFISVFK